MTTTFLHSLVSKQKRRFQEDGFDLDLSYVTDNIIAMGFPSEDNERFYRNPYSEVIRFLDKRHKDKFKIYNLCSERGYDPEKFYNRVGTFPFDDHNAPRFELIEELCFDIKEFLSIDPENVAVIHCKAGKGRTGLMICCWLLYNKEWPTAEAAQQFYAAMRTKNQKGVTIPSQIRYINYFEERMKMDKWDPDYQAIGLKSITLNGIPKIPHSSELKMTLIMDKKPFYPWKPSEQEKEAYKKAKKGKGGTEPVFVIDCGNYPVIRDVKVQLDEKKMTSQEVLCTFWFNTWFIKNNHLHIEQPEIDRANKDKTNKIFPEGFSIDIEFDPAIANKGKEKEDEDSDGYDENKGFEEEEEEKEEKDERRNQNFGRSGTLVVEGEDGEAIQISSKVAEPLNLRGGTYSGEPRNACEVSIELLDKAIALYKHCLPKNATSLIDSYVPKRTGEHEKEMFQAFETATSELNQISLDKLTENELALFWLNTLNVMYLHSFIVFGPPNRTTTREKILEKAHYSIGGLVYPLVVVEQFIILGGLGKGPSEIGGLKLPKIKMKEKDARKAFQLKNPSKLIVFGISGGAKCLPFLHVFRSADALEDDLKMLVKVALSEVHVKAEIIQEVPVYLSWYKKNFAKKEGEMVDTLCGIAGIELADNKGAVDYKKVDWAFDSFFLHFQKDVSLEEAWKTYREDKHQAKKEQSKADILQKMDDIDELEELENDGEEKDGSNGNLAASSPNAVPAENASDSAPNSARGADSLSNTGSSSSSLKGGGSKKKLKKSTSRKFKSIAGGSKSPDSPSQQRRDTESTPVKEKKDKKKKGKKEEERVIPPPPADYVPPPAGESPQ